MADRLYPTSLAEIDSWRRLHATTSEEARSRFIQFVILTCVGSSPWQRSVAFKGGNALRFVYQNPRSTVDLDFTANAQFPDDADQIQEMLNQALAIGSRRFGIKAKCQSVHRNPKSREKTLPTYEAKVSYVFPGDRYFEQFETVTRGLSRVVILEISLNDMICETTNVSLGPDDGPQIRVCTIEDIVAEKLRSLLQQKVRKRNRRQDVFDIARIVRTSGHALDRTKIPDFLMRKAAVRGIDVSVSAFDDEIRAKAAFEYERLEEDTGESFIPFDEAWPTVLGLVAELGLS